jgi:hypothetical protein
MTSLAKHLTSHHLREHRQVNHLYEVMQIVSPDILGGYGLFMIAQSQLDGTDSCPLAVNGCSFRLPINASYVDDHVMTHELLERVKLYEIFKERFPALSLDHGRITCPICQWQESGYRSLGRLARHINAHSRAGRERCTMQLFEFLQPWVLGKEELVWYEWRCLDKICSELRKAGASISNSAMGTTLAKIENQERHPTYHIELPAKPGNV